MSTRDKDGAQLRTAPRIKIFQPAEMERGGAPVRVHLLNISTGGALVHAPAVPVVGEEVRLTCGVPLGVARVQWTSATRFGVRFADPIGAARLAAIVESAQIPVGA